MNEVQSDALSDELLDEDIPCADCGKPALLMSVGHGTCPGKGGASPPFFKCVKCWGAWLQRLSSESFTCAYCEDVFDSVESFSDYREF